MKNKKQKAFTLIELLVVIAIIGLLSAIVLTALGAARAKAKDKAIISEMASIRPQAEIFYTFNGGNYGRIITNGPTSPTTSGGCNSASLIDHTLFGSSTAKGNVVNLLTAIQNKAGTGPQQTACAVAPAIPGSLVRSWAMAVRLTENGNNSDFYCVDSSGASKIIPRVDTGNPATSITASANAISSTAALVKCK